jgi:hypothetical protein
LASGQQDEAEAKKRCRHGSAPRTRLPPPPARRTV